jgi:hypothetical protein
LIAHWNPDGWSESGKPWRFSNDTDAIKALFKDVAESAAVELGLSGGEAGVFSWLDLLRRDSPYFKLFPLGGYIYRVCDASAEYCLKCETNAKAAARERDRTDSVNSTPIKTLAHRAFDDLPVLPSAFQDAFQAARNNAELEYATRAERFPNHLQFADAQLHLVILIQRVFFAFCMQARNARRAGEWSITQVVQSIDRAWPCICDSYLIRERGACSEQDKLEFRFAVWRTTTDDQQWKQHLFDLKALAERPSATNTARPQPQPGSTGQSEANAPRDQSTSSQGAAKKATSQTEFWKDRQAEFEKYAKEFSDLKAHWNSTYRKWTLWWGATPKGIHIPQECKGVFNAIARKAVTGLPRRGTTGGEPWQLWLDFMRAREWGYHITGTVACTEQEWDAGVKDGKPLAQVRREQRYTTGDEWKKIYRRTKSGKLRRLSARELKGKSSESLQKYFHWLENGTIEHVFEASARFCEDLSARAFESEAKSGRTESAGEDNKAERSDRPTSKPTRQTTVGAKGTMDQSTLDDLLRKLDEAGLRSRFEDVRWRIKEADYRSLERFCTECDLKPDELRECVETYLLETLDNVASVFLGDVAGKETIAEYERILDSWCAEVLPGLEGTWLPQIPEWLRQLAKRVPAVAAIASVHPGKLAARRAQALGKAIRKAKGTVPFPADAGSNRSAPELTSRAAAGRVAGWQGVEISFLSEERVQIRCGTNTETRNYGELGFADLRGKRGRPKPNLAWVTLRAMAQQNGMIRDGAKAGATWLKVEKRIQEIRKVLRKHFSITSDPVPFVKGTGYQACFKIGCGPSFHT